MSTVVPWVLVIVLSSVLAALVARSLCSSQGGSPLQALCAGGTAGVAAFGIGMTLLNTLS